MKHSYTGNAVIDVFKKNMIYTISLIIVVLLVVVLSLLPPQLLKIIIDDYLINRNHDGLLAISFLYLLSFILIGILDFSKGMILTVLGQKIVKKIRYDMAVKVTKIRSIYFTENAAGTITSRFINDVENVNELFSDGIVSMGIDCFKIIGIIISIWMFSRNLGIFVLCIVPVIYMITRLFRKRMFISQVRNLKELGKVNNHISESIKNMIMIKSFSRESYMEDKYESYLESNYETMNKVNFYDACYSPIIKVLTAVSVAFVLYIASGENNVLGISIGMVAASINLITNLFDPIDNLGTELQSIQTGISGIASINNFFLEEEDMKKDISVNVKELKKQGISLTFNEMSFAYDKDQDVLQDINLNINPGENVSIVGRTGVGKTTMFKLTAGMLKPSSGSIRLNGLDVYDIKNEQKRSLFGYVEQNFSFINGDIYDQITLGDENITKEQVEKAVKFVGLDEYIKKLEKGYNTQVSDKTLFSKGQSQLMSIARAIVMDPPILLLDEVTASLDSVTEEKVVDVLKRACTNKTILSITHRVSSVLNSDRVVLIEKGRIKSQGTPEEIINGSTWIRSSFDIESAD